MCIICKNYAPLVGFAYDLVLYFPANGWLYTCTTFQGKYFECFLGMLAQMLCNGLENKLKISRFIY